MKKVGKIKEAHGLKGDLSVLIFSQDVSWISQLKKCQIQKGSEVKTFDVLEAKPFKKGLILKVNGISDRNASEAIEGWDFLIPEDLLVSEPGETIYLSEILNFRVLDPQESEIGIVIDFSSNGAQDLLVIKKTNQDLAEIPFVPAFVKEIRFESKQIVLDLPEGLLDLASLED